MSWPLDIGREMEDQDMKDLDKFEENQDHVPEEITITELVPGMYFTTCWDDEIGAVHVAIEGRAADDGFTRHHGLTAIATGGHKVSVVDYFKRDPEDQEATNE